MNWTKDKPAQPGWYWYSDDYGTEIAKIDKRRFAAGGFEASLQSTDRAVSINYLDGHWLGPLEVPEGPE